MANKYDIESLIKAFESHAKTAEEQRMLDLEKFPEAEHLKDDFSISKALLSICEEIKELKSEIKYGKVYQRFKP